MSATTDRELTPWFDGSVTPVRVGEYERTFRVSDDSFVWKDLWTGSEWQYSDPHMDSTRCICQYRPWRGLASDPTQEPT